jgi:hypothetical protein
MFFELEVARQIKVLQARPEPEWPQIKNGSNVIRSYRNDTGNCLVNPAAAGETRFDAVSLKDSRRVKVLSLWDLSNCRETLAEQWIYRVCPMRAA